MPYNVREVQPTPNPNAVKFILDRPISDRPASYFSADAAQGDPVALRLFAIPGVSSLLFLGDFITVNKRPEAAWKEISKQVEKVLATT